MKKCGSILLLVIFLLSCVFVILPSTETLYNGVDVSVWQGDIDFEQVFEAGYTVAYIRVSAGSDYADPNFRENYEKAKNAGLRVGFYHYMSARTVTEARAEAVFFAGLIRNLQSDCKPAMDYEYFSGLSIPEIQRVALAFLEEAERQTGLKMVIYSDSYNAQYTFTSSELISYPLWVADYSTDNPPVGGFGNWDGFQYRDNGRVPGINGNVDLDYFKESVFLTEQAPLPPEKPQSKLYVVRRGDTLWSIANRYGTTISEIVQQNGIANPNLIYVGEILQIPVDVYKTMVYTVRPGDTLWGIAIKLHTTIGKLVEMNRIANPNLIYAGEQFIY